MGGFGKDLHVMEREHLFEAIERHLILSRHDAKGRILGANAGFCTIFGDKATQGPKINPLLEGDELSPELATILEQGETWHGRKSFYFEQEHEVIVDMTAIPILTPTLSEILVLIEDVTAVVHAGRVQQERQIQMKIDRLMAQKQHHQEISRIKDSFLTIFTHELRTPLNAVINFSRHLFKHLNDIQHKKKALLREEAKLIAQSGEQMLDMIDNIALAIRLRDRAFDLQYESLILYDTVKSIGAKFDPDTVMLHIEIDALLRIESDYKAMTAILYNLVGNAVKYGQGITRVTCKQEGVCFVLEVSDNGSGFKAKDERLFHLFEQSDADTMTREGKGAGVGLYVVKKLCEALGYTIELDQDRLLGGAQVRIHGNTRGLHV